MKKLILTLLWTLSILLPTKTFAQNPEPYAVLEGTTLTFYYNDEKAAKGGMSVGPFTGNYDPNSGQYVDDDRGWYDARESITTVEFDESFKEYTDLTSTAYWFNRCHNLSSIKHIEYLNTGKVEDMMAMFYECSSLTDLDVKGFDTQNAVNLQYMFYGCDGLTSLDVSGFNTSKAQIMFQMFAQCSGLTSLDVSKFDTENVFTMRSMFSGCSSLTALDVSLFKTGNVTDMGFMFNGCSKLTALDVSGFDTGNVTSMEAMFANCSGLTSLDVTKFKTENVTDMGDMFRGCSSLTSLEVSGFNTSNVTSMYMMFRDCSSLTSLDVSGFNTSNVTDMGEMFRGCSGLMSLNLGGYNIDKVTYLDRMFFGCSGLTSLDLGSFNTSNVTSLWSVFEGCSGLISLDLSSFKTDNVTNMYSLFEDCSNLQTIIVGSDWNTEKVTSSTYMFRNCEKLVGGMGTAYDSNHTDAAYAHIDGGTANPGYFTDKNPNYVDGLYLTYIINGLEWHYKIVSVADQTCEICHPLVPFWSAIPNTTEGEVAIPSIINGFKVISIGNYALYQCGGLTGSLVIPEGVVSIGSQAFYGCTGYTGELVLPTTLKSLGKEAFGGCSNLTGELHIPNGVEEIGEGAFSGCSSLTGSLTFPESLKTLGAYAFNYCSGLTGSLVIPTVVTEIGAGTFQKCSGLTGTLTIHDGVTKIGERAFNECGFTGELTIPNSVTFIDGLAFGNCKGFTGQLVLPANLTYIGSIVFQGCTGFIGELVIPESLTSLNDYGYEFNGCTGLTSVVLHAGLLSGSGSYSFSGCTGLQSVTANMENPFEISSSFFDAKNYEEAILYVPAGKVEVYQNTPNWSLFQHIQEKGNTGDPEPYAVLEGYVASGQTLKFYYDDKKADRAGMDVGPFANFSDRPWNGSHQGIVKVEFDESMKEYTGLTSTAHWFENFTSLNSVQGIENLKTANVTDMSCMFYLCMNLEHLAVDGFNTSNVTDMQYMFGSCSKLKDLELQSFNTENVTNMKGMFTSCEQLTGLDLSSFNTAKVTDMTDMFYQCGSLTTLLVPNFNTAQVTGMGSMFYNCSALTTLDVTSFNTAKVTDMSSMFNRCLTLTTLNVSSFDVGNVLDFGGMFVGCTGLTELDLSNFDTHSATRMVSMFAGCENLTKIYASEKWDNSHVTSGDDMFENCYNLKGGQGTVYEQGRTGVTFARIDGGTANPGYFTDANAPRPYIVMRNDMAELTFYYDEGLHTDGIVAKFNGQSLPDEMFDARSVVKSVVFDPSFANYTTLTSTASWFLECSQLESITGFEYLKTDNVTDMTAMFALCSSLKELDLSTFNTAKVVSMHGMFANCEELTTIYVGNGWSTASIVNGNDIFIGCTHLQGGMGTEYTQERTGVAFAHIDGGENNPGLLTDKNAPVVLDEIMAYGVLTDQMKKMTLYYDKNMASHTEGMTLPWGELLNGYEYNHARETLVTIDIDPSFANFNTLESSGYIFAGCMKLTAIHGLQYLVTDNMTDMQEMFASCESLTELDLSSFNTSHVTRMWGMFQGCSHLKTIIVGPGWTTAALTDEGHEMFAGCTNLVGEKGTTYSEPNFNADYAHIDGGPSNPGYLTGTGEQIITEFEVNGIVYRVRHQQSEHQVMVAHVIHAEEELYVPSEVPYANIHWHVTALAEKAFADLHETKAIDIPESIDSISVDLFNHCPHLAAITWRTNVALTAAAMGEFNNPNLLFFLPDVTKAPANVTNVVDLETRIAEKIVLTDAPNGGNDFYCPEPVKATLISYTHSYNQATKIGTCQGWESIVVPFDVETYIHETKGEIYPIASLLDEQIEYDGDKPFWLYEFTHQDEFVEADQIRANRPYIISMPNDPDYWDSYILTGQITFIAKNVEIYPTHEPMVVESQFRVFVPNYANADYQNPDAFLLNVGDAYDGHLPGSVFSSERPNRIARPFEAYFVPTGNYPAKRYMDIFDTEVDAIREIPMAAKAKEGIYDLTGRKVEDGQLTKGVYIIDGKKVMVK